MKIFKIGKGGKWKKKKKKREKVDIPEADLIFLLTNTRYEENEIREWYRSANLEGLLVDFSSLCLNSEFPTNSC